LIAKQRYNDCAIKLLTMLYDEKRMSNANDTYTASRKVVVAECSNTNQQTDQVIWDAFKSGDELAFTHIYTNYSRLLFQYGCKYSADKELVRDCLQDFFLYLKKNRLGFGSTNSIKLYLLKAFRRRVLDYLRKDRIHLNIVEPSEYILFGIESSIEAVFINKQIKAEQLDRLNKALKTLDRIEQDVIYYFYFKGMSYEQIAEIFKFSHVSSARRVMYRSLRQLRVYFSYS